MRYLILSDIHSNWEALESVLEAAAGSYDKILCCGDIVGYGADPNAVTDWVRSNVRTLVRGNHDKACCGMDDMEWFNPSARDATLWTRENLSEGNLEYLRAMPRGPLPVEDFQIAHGSPLDEDEYLVDNADALLLRGYLDTAVSFFGHTHLQGGFQVHSNGIRRVPPMNGSEDSSELRLEENDIWLVNPGSVGQPRDGDPRAAFAIYDSQTRLVSFRRAGYDVRAAQEKILTAGLPELLARRLSSGR